MKTLNLVTLLIALAAVITGCNSIGYRKAQDTSTSLTETAQSIDNALPPLEAVVQALDTLAQKSDQDIVGQYKSYSDAIDSLTDSVQIVHARAKDMQLLGDDYFRNWESEIAKIQSNEIQSKSRDRKIDVSTKYNKLSQSYLEADKQLLPFMSYLTDIRTAIGADLTKAGLNSVQSLLKQAKQDASRIRDSLLRLSSDFRDLGVQLSSNSSPPTA